MKNFRYVFWFVLLGGLLVVLNLPTHSVNWVKGILWEAVAPFQMAASGVADKARDVSTAFRGLRELTDENRRLASELIRMRSQLLALQQMSKENDALRASLQFTRQAEREFVPCEVIGRDISGWWQALRLGKGYQQRVQPNRAVVVADGLVGKTRSVSSRTCDVLLLPDPACRVAALIPRTQTFGIVRGEGVSSDGRALCRMDFINKDAAIRAGDEVVTSGLGGVFPPGFRIGYIEQIEQDQTGLYQSARVVPQADLGHLNFVFVAADGADAKTPPIDAGDDAEAQP